LTSENKGGVLICNFIKTFPPIFDLRPPKNFPLFFTGHKLHPPGIGIEATVNKTSIFHFTKEECYVFLTAMSFKIL